MMLYVVPASIVPMKEPERFGDCVFLCNQLWASVFMSILDAEELLDVPIQRPAHNSKSTMRHLFTAGEGCVGITSDAFVSYLTQTQANIVDWYYVLGGYVPPDFCVRITRQLEEHRDEHLHRLSRALGAIHESNSKERRKQAHIYDHFVANFRWSAEDPMGLRVWNHSRSLYDDALWSRTSLGGYDHPVRKALRTSEERWYSA